MLKCAAEQLSLVQAENGDDKLLQGARDRPLLRNGGEMEEWLPWSVCAPKKEPLFFGQTRARDSHPAGAHGELVAWIGCEVALD